MRTHYEVSYSYPTSENARAFGFGRKGCWTVSSVRRNGDGVEIVKPHSGYQSRDEAIRAGIELESVAYASGAAPVKHSRDMKTMTEINAMERQELIAADVAAGVAKWGEAERPGLLRMATQKSDATLRAQLALREGLDPHAVEGVEMVHQPTLGALEDGIS